MNITVYCGAGFGNDVSLKEQVELFGKKIAQAGDRLVFGGSETGLMGVLADAVLSEGGSVTGVELKYFAEKNLSHTGLSELLVADTLSGRKQMMIDRGDAFVALPGGAGTLDEISEIITLKNIGILNKPCILFNWKGYYEPLAAFYDQMRMAGFMHWDIRQLVYLADDAEDIMQGIGGGV